MMQTAAAGNLSYSRLGRCPITYRLDLEGLAVMVSGEDDSESLVMMGEEGKAMNLVCGFFYDTNKRMLMCVM